jgi:DNA (cytosine-5)-methyltransferase 1
MRLSTRNKFKVISLFSGCGGLDLGFIWEGYQIIWANDNFVDAIRTYRKNIGNTIIEDDIKKIDTDKIPQGDIVIGGPPCQSFSLVGKRDAKDPRGNLVWNFYEVVESNKPKIFVMENVVGLKSARDKKGTLVLPFLVKCFARLGYTINYFIMNAADYGVPQRRRRLFIIGNKAGIQIPIPEPTHARHQSQTSFLGLKNHWITSKEALDDLSSPSINTDVGYYRKKPDCSYQRFIRFKNKTKVTSHQMPYMSETDLKIIKVVPPGGNYKDIPDSIATTRIKKFKKTGGRTTTYGRLHPTKPAYTINTHFSRPNVGCNIHYREDRLITIREGLRLQSFPDTFNILHGSKRSAYMQVGNAVPPLLAKVLAKHLKKYL